uniref:Uncharacterized protein n=1 Tax=Caenorhabditis japonica TaxID=281687 RepID=A0A8R1IB35_CAEJA
MWRKARRRGGGQEHLLDMGSPISFSHFCEHSECDESVSSDVRLHRRISNVEPDVSMILDGEEEFEEKRQKELASLRASLETINEEIKDSLRNETISGSEERSNRWEKVPIEMRPLIEAIYAQTVAHVKKEVELDFKLTKTKNEFTSKMTVKKSLEEKKKRDDEELRSRYRELAQSVEDAKSELHQKISFILCLIKCDRIDEKFLQQLESLKNQFCDVEHKIKKTRPLQRRTTNFAGGLTPKPELKRNERNRRAVHHYGNVVNSEDVTLDDSRHFNARRKDVSLSSFQLNQHAEENVRRRVAMSPIRFDDNTRLDEEDENQENVEEEEFSNATFVKDGPTTSEANSNSTFVISKAAPLPSSEALPPMRYKSRRTDLGPL